MLEIRYNKITKEVTGWWGNRHGNEDVKLKNRPDERLVLLDTPIPDKPSEAWFCDGKKLTLNLDYVEPGLPRDLEAEIDELKARLDDIAKVSRIA